MPISCLLVAACTVEGPYPKAFTTDGCSGFPDGTINDPEAWRRHCVEHDRAYWAGGTREERKLADTILAESLKADGHPVAGCLAYMGTRLGGHPFLPTPWRWGYAWRYPRDYRPLTAEERAALADAAPTAK